MSDVSDEDLADLRQTQRKRWIINDKQWRSLQSLSGISDADRRHVEIALRIYRNMAYERLGAPVLTSADTRDQLQKLAKDALSVHKSIERALDNNHAIKVLSGPPDKVWENVEVWALSDALCEFSQMVQSAAERCERARPGPSNDNLWGLASSLARLWVESSGERLSVSTKRCGPDRTWNALEFITKAVQIADPKMKDKDSSIRDVVKTLARAMKSGES